MKEQLLSYFLGELSDEQQIQVEEEYFDNDEKYLEFEAAQNDLIDAYVKNQLSASEKEKFKKYLELTPGLQKRVQMAQALSIHIAKLNESQSPVSEKKAHSTLSVSWWQSIKDSFQSFNLFLRFVFALGMAFMILALVFTFFEQQKYKELAEKKELQLLESQKQQTKTLEQLKLEQANSAELSKKLSKEESEKEKLESQLAENSIVEKLGIELYPILVRSSGGQKILNISEKTNQRVKFKLNLPKSSYKPSQIVIKIGSKVVFEENNLSKNASQANNVLSFEISTSVLEENDYILQVNGKDKGSNLVNIQDYVFSVRKK